MRLTHKSVYICALVTFLIITPHAFTIEIYVNDTFYMHYSDSDLEARVYKIPLSGELVEGVTLLEVMPLMSDAYRMDVSSPEGIFT